VSGEARFDVLGMREGGAKGLEDVGIKELVIETARNCKIVGLFYYLI
jgi:hypothetical protein